MKEGCSGSAQGPKMAGEKAKIGQQLAFAREMAAGCSVRGRREKEAAGFCRGEEKRGRCFCGAVQLAVVARLLPGGARGEGRKKEKGEEGK